jgi:hypothetical protein
MSALDREVMEGMPGKGWELRWLLFFHFWPSPE